MISNSYSTARMWALTKRYAVENRRNIFITLGVMFGILLLISLIITKSNGTELSPNEMRPISLWIFYLWACSLAVSIIGSLTFSSMSSKSKRISNLMIPASQSEKFISQCLLYVVGGNLALIISLLVADAVSGLFYGYKPGWIQLGYTTGFFDVVSSNPKALHLTVMIGLGILWAFLFGQSIYVLGSAWWPKKSFLKTFVALFVLQWSTILLIPFGLVTDIIPDCLRWLRDNITEFNVFFIGWCVIVLLYLLLAGVYFLAWQRYKRLEVVKRFLN